MSPIISTKVASVRETRGGPEGCATSMNFKRSGNTNHLAFPISCAASGAFCLAVPWRERILDMSCAGCHANDMFARLVYQFNKQKTQQNPKLYRSTIRESTDSPNQDVTHLTDNAVFLSAGLPMRLQSSIFADTSHWRAWTRRGTLFARF